MTAPIAALLEPSRDRAALELFCEHFTSRSDRSTLLGFLPPHMRAAAAAWGFGERQQLIEVHALGTRWFADGFAAVDSGLPVCGIRPNGSRALKMLVSRRGLAERWPVERGLVTWLGPAVVETAYVRLVEALYPSATWEVAGAEAPVLAMVAGRARAVVMPVGMKKVVADG